MGSGMGCRPCNCHPMKRFGPGVAFALVVPPNPPCDETAWAAFGRAVMAWFKAGFDVLRNWPK